MGLTTSVAQSVCETWWAFPDFVAVVFGDGTGCYVEVGDLFADPAWWAGLVPALVRAVLIVWVGLVVVFGLRRVRT